MAAKIKFIGKIKVGPDRTGRCSVVKLFPSENALNEPSIAEPLFLQPGLGVGNLVPLRCEDVCLVGRANPWPDVWIYKGKAFRVYDWSDLDSRDIAVRIEELVLKSDAHENPALEPSSARERISAAIQVFVWRCDQGQCVQCGGKERLEFDHVIPVAKGGSHTARNIQLLCESCNRKKGKRVGY